MNEPQYVIERWDVTEWNVIHLCASWQDANEQIELMKKDCGYPMRIMNNRFSASENDQFCRDEIDELRKIIWAAASSNSNGELLVSHRDMQMFRKDDCELEFHEDKENRMTLIRAKCRRQP